MSFVGAVDHFQKIDVPSLEFSIAMPSHSNHLLFGVLAGYGSPFTIMYQVHTVGLGITADDGPPREAVWIIPHVDPVLAKLSLYDTLVKPNRLYTTAAVDVAGDACLDRRHGIVA